jgi:eukaryotic-like serine/threonine-protein kinase
MEQKTFMIGKIISHYKILEKLGEGGMGVVYKAEDTKLKRTVALKFLPHGLETHEPERVRFMQEAQTAAALNHANICTIHDIAVEGNDHFIVMEYVDGKTLRQIVPVQKIQDAIDYAIQIGEALQEAHSHGVVHRDIKTENIMVNSKNQIKVMDFGLAKLKGSLKLTKTSSTVGTLAYMSPEQVQGSEVDGRSDIFSFGVVLYEMLTGHLPFHGEYEAAMVYSIVNEKPDSVQIYRPDISSEILHILNRSLEKNPEERYQNVHDMVIDLKRAKKAGTPAEHRVPIQSTVREEPIPVKDNQTDSIASSLLKDNTPTKNGNNRKIRLAILAALIFIVIVTAIFSVRQFLKEPLPPLKIVPLTSLPGVELMPAFSPNGDQIAFVWNEGDDSKGYNIFVKLIGTETPLKLTNNLLLNLFPMWSPDGRTIAFQRYGNKETGIYKIPALAGTVQRLLASDTMEPMGLDWSPDGQYLVFADKAAADAPRSIFKLSVPTLEKQQLTFPSNEMLGDLFPKVSPNGQWIAFARESSWNSIDIFIIPFSGGEEKRITFDNKFIKTTVTWTQDGRDIIFDSNRSGVKSLWRIPFKGGEPKPITFGGEDVEFVSVARTGDKLAYSKGSSNRYTLKGEIPKKKGQIADAARLIASSRTNYQARFSHDGNKIVFTSEASGSTEIWLCARDGSNAVQLTNCKGYDIGTPVFSPDDQFIAFSSHVQGNGDVCVMNANGVQLRRLTNEPSEDIIPTWSRDGQWIYFTSNRGGKNSIWKVPAQEGPAIQVSKDAGWRTCESPDGKRLYYSDIDTRKIWQLTLESGEKQVVLDSVSLYNWMLAKDGIYYIKWLSETTNQPYLGFLSFASNRTEKLVELKSKYLGFLDVSPDRRSFLVSESVAGEQDLYLVENFR